MQAPLQKLLTGARSFCSAPTQAPTHYLLRTQKWDGLLVITAVPLFTNRLRGSEYSPTLKLAKEMTSKLLRNPVICRASLDGRLRPRHAFCTAQFARTRTARTRTELNPSPQIQARFAVPLHVLALHSDEVYLQYLPGDPRPSVADVRAFEAGGDFKTR